MEDNNDPKSYQKMQELTEFKVDYHGVDFEDRHKRIGNIENQAKDIEFMTQFNKQLVAQQQDPLEQITKNYQETNENTKKGVVEIKQAFEYDGTENRKMCLWGIFMVGFLIFLFLLLSL